MGQASHLFVGHRAVTATEIGQDGWLGGLDAVTHAGHATIAVGLESLPGGVFGIALDRDLTVGRARNGVKNPEELRR